MTNNTDYTPESLYLNTLNLVNDRLYAAGNSPSDLNSLLPRKVIRDLEFAEHRHRCVGKSKHQVQGDFYCRCTYWDDSDPELDKLADELEKRKTIALQKLEKKKKLVYRKLTTYFYEKYFLEQNQSERIKLLIKLL